MEWQIATQTHRGNVRRINEDALLAEKYLPLLVVADGMGGHEAGEVASRMLIEGLASTNFPPSLSDALELAKSSIMRSNEKLVEYAELKLSGKLVGSTVVAMLAQESSGACLWAGDSRLYRVRDHQLEQITGDHSFVADMVRSGQLSEHEALDHPSSNMITRAVGTSSDLELDCQTFDIQLGDTFLLCSDGLYNEIAAEELLISLLAGDIWQSSNQMLNLCLSRRARDNISFIIARPVELGEDELDATLTYYPQDS